MTEIERIRARIAAIRAKREAGGRKIQPTPPPRYDAVFWEGVAWLDSLGNNPEEVSLRSEREP